MKSKSIDKEIMYLESIQLLFIFYKLHRECLSFFSNKADRNTFFEDTNFWEDHFNFPIHFINGIELNEKPTEKLLSFSFGKLRLFIFNNMCLDNFHLIKYNFLTQITFTTFIINLMFNFIFVSFSRRIVFYTPEHHSVNLLLLIILIKYFIYYITYLNHFII